MATVLHRPVVRKAEITTRRAVTDPPKQRLALPESSVKEVLIS
jgi:hypothetical protein